MTCRWWERRQPANGKSYLRYIWIFSHFHSGRWVRMKRKGGKRKKSQPPNIVCVGQACQNRRSHVARSSSACILMSHLGCLRCIAALITKSFFFFFSSLLPFHSLLQFPREQYCTNGRHWNQRITDWKHKKENRLDEMWRWHLSFFFFLKIIFRERKCCSNLDECTDRRCCNNSFRPVCPRQMRRYKRELEQLDRRERLHRGRVVGKIEKEK